MTASNWLQVHRGEAPLLVSLPHTGTDLPPDLEARLVSPWLARKDADWWIDQLYAFAAGLGATVVRTTVSRTAIDVNRDPSGISLYPGQATTELCPTTSFDGEPLYRAGQEPDAEEIARAADATGSIPIMRRSTPRSTRLQARNARIAVYDCHSIRSVIPRLFEGRLPAFNIGTNGGTSCAPALSDGRRGDLPGDRAGAASSTAASAAASSRAASAARTRASTPSRWNSPAGPICASRRAPSPRPTGRRPMIRLSRSRCAKLWRGSSTIALPWRGPRDRAETDPRRRCAPHAVEERRRRDDRIAGPSGRGRARRLRLAGQHGDGRHGWALFDLPQHRSHADSARRRRAGADRRRRRGGASRRQPPPLLAFPPTRPAAVVYSADR